MIQTIEQLFQAAMALPPEDRLRLAEEIMAASEPPVGLTLDATGWAEIQRRSAEYDAGGVTPISWAKVKDYP